MGIRPYRTGGASLLVCLRWGRMKKEGEDGLVVEQLGKMGELEWLVVCLVGLIVQ